MVGRCRNNRNNTYVMKDRHGRIVGSVKIGRSLAADRRRKSFNVPKSKGHGNQGDYFPFGEPFGYKLGKKRRKGIFD